MSTQAGTQWLKLKHFLKSFVYSDSDLEPENLKPPKSSNAELEIAALKIPRTPLSRLQDFKFVTAAVPKILQTRNDKAQ